MQTRRLTTRLLAATGLALGAVAAAAAPASAQEPEPVTVDFTFATAAAAAEGTNIVTADWLPDYPLEYEGETLTIMFVPDGESMTFDLFDDDDRCQHADEGAIKCNVQLGDESQDHAFVFEAELTERPDLPDNFVFNAQTNVAGLDNHWDSPEYQFVLGEEGASPVGDEPDPGDDPSETPSDDPSGQPTESASADSSAKPDTLPETGTSAPGVFIAVATAAVLTGATALVLTRRRAIHD